jgi:hypothetical protein
VTGQLTGSAASSPVWALQIDCGSLLPGAEMHQVIAAMGSTTVVSKGDGGGVFTVYQLLQQLGAASLHLSVARAVRMAGRSHRVRRAQVLGYSLPLWLPLETSDTQLYIHGGFCAVAWLTFLMSRMKRTPDSGS